MLCDDLEGWDGGTEGPRGRVCVCVHTAASLHCAAEINTTL